MRAYPGCLPSRFPVGTKYVVEGRPGGKGQGQVFSRYLEFPDGTIFDLPVVQAPPLAPRRARRRRARSAPRPVVKPAAGRHRIAG